jgi:hypothetical protein
MPLLGILARNLIQDCLNHYHCSLSNSPMQFLLMYGPFGHLPYQALLIGIYELPQLVEELPDHLYGACIKTFMHELLHCIKPVFVNFPISVFSTSPVL